MAELSYRDAVIRGISQEMERDNTVVFLGEDVAKAGGVFKATVGLYEKFGPLRVRDTPISEQAILGAAMGAAMTGLRRTAESPALTNSLVQLDQTLRRIDQLVAGKDNDIQSALDNLRVLTGNLRELSENAKRFPAQLLFGEPPKPSKNSP